MSDFTATAQSATTPAHPRTHDQSAGSGSAAQLNRHLNECATQLTSFSEDILQELHDILATLSPGLCRHIPATEEATTLRRATTDTSPEMVSRTIQNSSDAAKLQESGPTSTEVSSLIPEEDDHARLAAIKLRIADRLRNEMNQSDVHSRIGAQS